MYTPRTVDRDVKLATFSCIAIYTVTLMPKTRTLHCSLVSQGKCVFSIDQLSMFRCSGHPSSLAALQYRRTSQSRSEDCESRASDERNLIKDGARLIGGGGGGYIGRGLFGTDDNPLIT